MPVFSWSLSLRLSILETKLISALQAERSKNLNLITFSYWLGRVIDFKDKKVLEDLEKESGLRGAESWMFGVMLKSERFTDPNAYVESIKYCVPHIGMDIDVPLDQFADDDFHKSEELEIPIELDLS